MKFNHKTKNQDNRIIKQLIQRYLILIFLLIIITSQIHAIILQFVLTNWSFLFLQLFYNVELINHTIMFNGGELLIIDACLGLSNYILFALLFFSIQKNIKIISKTYFQSYLLFTLLNYLRIIFLMSILIIFGDDKFKEIHSIFQQFINAIITAGTFILIYKINNIEKKPFLDDIKYLIKIISKR